MFLPDNDVAKNKTVDTLPTHEYLVDVQTPALQIDKVLRSRPCFPDAH